MKEDETEEEEEEEKTERISHRRGRRGRRNKFIFTTALATFCFFTSSLSFSLQARGERDGREKLELKGMQRYSLYIRYESKVARRWMEVNTEIRYSSRLFDRAWTIG